MGYELRGKCKEECEKLILEQPNLELVRGYYYEYSWGDKAKQQHWWCKDLEGNIIDPTASQFPSGGIEDFYEEFTGVVECEECGQGIKEEEAYMMGRFPVCSSECARNLVGL